MSPPLEHRSSLWITRKENGPEPNKRIQCVLVGAYDGKCSRDQRLNTFTASFHIFSKAAKVFATMCHGRRVSFEKSMGAKCVNVLPKARRSSR
jgi:hypothetical protein